MALYRFGVAVLVGLSPVEEDDFLRQIKARVSGERDRVDDETAVLEVAADGEDRISPGGPIHAGPVAAAAARGGRRPRQDGVARRATSAR